MGLDYFSKYSVVRTSVLREKVELYVFKLFLVNLVSKTQLAHLIRISFWSDVL